MRHFEISCWRVRWHFYCELLNKRTILVCSIYKHFEMLDVLFILVCLLTVIEERVCLSAILWGSLRCLSFFFLLVLSFFMCFLSPLSLFCLLLSINSSLAPWQPIHMFNICAAPSAIFLASNLHSIPQQKWRWLCQPYGCFICSYVFLVYRPITLLNVAYRIFAIILNQRMVDIIETELGDYQSGCRPNRSTIDNIFMIRQIIKKCYEYNIDIHNLFIDYTHAFDSINLLAPELFFFNFSTSCI